MSRHRIVDGYLNGMKLRLREPMWWFPLPLFISASLVMILTAHVISGTNPRTGNPADIITFPSEPRKDSALWMTITQMDEEIVVTTGDRRVFRWHQQVKTMEELAPFIKYLKERVAGEIESAALMKRAFTTQTSAVIAADQRLKFLHVRPLLYALAAAGISQYAFETQNPAAVSELDRSETHEPPAG
jgi:hypothetical protein